MNNGFVTITFNPCIDRYATVEKLVPEKKLSCNKGILQAGGGGINVAKALVRLGRPAGALYPSGGYTGAYLNALLKKEEVITYPIETTAETRENIIILEESTHSQYRFGMPGNCMDEYAVGMLLSRLKQMPVLRYVIVSGSLPPGIPDDIFIRIKTIIEDKGALLVIDSSGDALQWALKARPFLLKPNVQELGSIVRRELTSLEAVHEAAYSLVVCGHCKVIAVSMGAKGVLLVSEGLHQQFIPPLVIPVSTVGAGDSLVAGIISALSDHRNLSDAIKYGVACGTAATLRPGTELCTRIDADRLYHSIQVTELLTPSTGQRQ